MQNVIHHKNTTMRIFLCLTGAMAFTTGCASNKLTQSEIKYLQTRQIDRPFHQTYDAALNAMFGLGYSITHTDKQSGIIAAQLGDYGHQSMMSAKEREENPVQKVTLMVRPHGRDQTVLRMKLLINELPKQDPKIVTALWMRIEREAMLDAGPGELTRTNQQPVQRTRQ